MKEFGEVHGTIEITSRKEVTSANLRKQLWHIFRDADEIHLESKTVLAEQPLFSIEPCAAIPVSATLEKLTRECACDWVLFEPENLTLKSSGTGGLEEFREHLSEDQVLFGIVRFAKPYTPGDASVQLSKYIFIHWVGPAMKNNVKRSHQNARHKNVLRTECNKHFSLALSLTAYSRDELALQTVLAKLKCFTTFNVPCVDVTSRQSNFVDLQVTSPGVEVKRRASDGSREAINTATPNFSDAEDRPQSDSAPNLFEVKAAAVNMRTPACAWDWICAVAC